MQFDRQCRFLNVRLWPVLSITGRTLRNKKGRLIWWMSVLLALVTGGCVAGKMVSQFDVETLNKTCALSIISHIDP